MSEIKPPINHAHMVKILAKSGEEILQVMTPEDEHVHHMCMGITGEVGELIDAIKKHTIYRKPLDRTNVIEELGDLEFYLEGLRQWANISREETIEANITKLAKRYEGFKYSDEAARNRADKVES